MRETYEHISRPAQGGDHAAAGGIQKSSKKGFAAALGAVEAIGALLARPGEACAAADFARIAKRREANRRARQRR